MHGYSPKKKNGIAKTERKVKKKFPAPFSFFLRERSKTFHNLECVIEFHFICDAKQFLTISNVKSRRTTSHIIYIREGNSDHDGIRCACMCVEGSKAYTTKTSPQADVARCCCCSFFICAFFTHPKFFTSSSSAPAEWK